jgi:hypothetical protein
MQGYISQVEEVTPPATDSKTGRAAAAESQDDKNAKGKGFSKGAKIAIVVGIGVAVVAAIIGYKASHPLAGINLGEL